MGRGRWSENDRGARRDGGEHAVVGAGGKVVDLHTDDRVGAHGLGAGAHFVDGGCGGAADLFLVLGGAATEHVGQVRTEILEHVDAGDRLAGDHADVLLNGRTLNDRGRHNEHHSLLHRGLTGQHYPRSRAMASRTQANIRSTHSATILHKSASKHTPKPLHIHPNNNLTSE